jgi:hypothetical protein
VWFTVRSHCRWPEQTAHYIEVAALRKHGGRDFPGIPLVKLQLQANFTR